MQHESPPSEVVRLAHPYHSRYPAEDIIILASPGGPREATEHPLRFRVSIDEQHVALPKLYGAPAYARPPSLAATVERPFDPDDLPIEAFQTEEDRAFAAKLPARAWAPGGGPLEGRDDARRGNGSRHLVGRQLNLRSIAGKLLRGD